MKNTTSPNLGMRRNCSLDLCLVTPPPLSSDDVDSMKKETTSNENQAPQQQMTFFYDGKIYSRSVSELQARTILNHARRETELRSPYGCNSEPASPSLGLYSPTGISMKRSLQRFLEKRKNRLQATNSPYN